MGGNVSSIFCIHARGPVGVEGAAGLDSDRSDVRPDGVVGVLDRELLKSFRPPAPLTLVRLVPAAARSCCCCGVKPDTPPPPRLSRLEL